MRLFDGKLEYPKIRKLAVNDDFFVLWLKYVEDVNLLEHCAKGLLGPFDKKIWKFANQWEYPKTIGNHLLDQAEVDFYYLCGVAQPSNWFKNFHCVFRYSEGEMMEVVENGIEFYVEDAARIEIKEIDREVSTEKYKNNIKYYSCRNWQFANEFENLTLKYGKKRKSVMNKRRPGEKPIQTRLIGD